VAVGEPDFDGLEVEGDAWLAGGENVCVGVCEVVEGGDGAGLKALLVCEVLLFGCALFTLVDFGVEFGGKSDDGEHFTGTDGDA
jgi:hypothetical protein